MNVATDLPLRRNLVIVATSQYQDLAWDPLDGVRTEVAAIAGWLCDPQLGNRRFTRQLRPLANNPTAAEVRAGLQDPGPEWTADDAVFLFITGHGHQDTESRRHYLALTTTERNSLRRTGIATDELVGWLHETGVDHLLLVVDACYSGAMASDALRNVPKMRSNWAVLTSSSADEEATTGALTSAIRAFLDELGSRTGEKFGSPGEYLTVFQFLSEVNEKLRGQTLTWLGGGGQGQHICLPNPHLRPRGAGDPDALFVGRDRLMTELVKAATGAAGVTLVTGGAGTGKSAALARLTKRTEGVISVQATGQTHAQVLSRICQAVGLPAATTIDGWRDWLAGSGEPVTVVVDALDEARSPDMLVREVLDQLEPDGEPDLVRLLVGVRSVGGDTTPPSGRLRGRRICVDDDEWWEQADLTGYVARVLTRPDGSPYRSLVEGDLDELAGAIAHRAGRSFLVAGLYADSLAHGETVSNPDSLHAMDDGVVGVFRDDLHRTFPEPTDRTRAVALLRATAFGQGVGLPWLRVWSTVANVIAPGNGDYDDTDILWLLDSRVGGYLVRDQEDELHVYRPAHDLLRTALRNSWRKLLDP
ncbi:MAG: AAA family ATPase [Labedaea sp.]